MQLTSYQISNIQTKIKIISEQLIVLVCTMGDKSIPRGSAEKLLNIYRLDHHYNIIWQVKEIKTQPIDSADMFVYLGQNEKGEIIADRFSGFEYKINPETGEATRIGFHK